MCTGTEAIRISPPNHAPPSPKEIRRDVEVIRLSVRTYRFYIKLAPPYAQPCSTAMWG